MSAPRYPRTTGISSHLSHDAPCAPGTVAFIYVDRGLKSGKLDRVELTERELAKLVADGAAVLHRLAQERSS